MTILLNRRLNGRPMLVSPATSSFSVVLALTNGKTSTVAAGAPITIGHSFAPGDIPAGASVAVSGMTVQQDQESYWGDGSLRFAALALRDTGRTYGSNGGGSDTQSMTVSRSASAPNRTAPFTLQQYLAANDHKLQVTPLNGDGDPNVYVVSPATIVANSTLPPWDAGAVVLPNGCTAGATSIVVSSSANISVGQSISTNGKGHLTFVSAVSGNTVSVLPVPTNVVQNQDFASPATSSYPGYGAIPNWTTSGGGGQAGANTPGGAFWDNANGPGAANGAQTCAFFQCQSATSFVALSQTLSGLTVGRTYQVSYLENRRAGGSGGNLYLQVTLDSTVIVAKHGLSSGSWVPQAASFTATATSHTLTFTATTDGTDCTALVTEAIVTDGTPGTTSKLPAIAAGGTLYFNAPVSGYDVVRTGPNCSEWKFWSYLRVATGASAGKYHCQVRATLYVRAWGVNGPFEIEALVENSNVFGNHPYGALGPTTATSAVRFSCNAELYNGNTLLYAWGGPHDARATTLAATSITNQGGVATITPALPVAWDNGTGIQFAPASGTLPGGLLPGVGYWTDGNNLGQSAASHIFTDRAFVSGVASGSVTIGAAGAGTVGVYPTLSVFGMASMNLATNTAEPVWDPGASGVAIRPHLMPTHDHDYMVASKVILPFDWSRSALPRSSHQMSDRGTYANLSAFYPGQPQPWQTPWNISQYGDDPGDDRVGWIRQIEAELYYNQSNIYSDMMLRCSARRFWNYNTSVRNERSGYPFANTDGPNHDGVQYTGLGPVNGTAATGPEVLGNTGSAGPFLAGSLHGPNWSGNQDTYGPVVDAAHLPCTGAGAYHRYGHRIFLDQMQQICGTIQYANSNWNDVRNGKNYWCAPTSEYSEQTRGIAWRLRCLSQAEYFSPSSGDLYQPFITDTLDYGGQYLLDWIANHDSWKDGVGIFNYRMTDPNVALYMCSFLAVSVSMIAWRDATSNRRPGYKTWLSNHFSKLVIGLWDTDQGGGMAFVNLIAVIFYSNATDVTTVPQSVAALWSLNNRAPNTGLIDNSDGSNSFQGGWPFDTDVYGTIAFASWSLMAWIGIPKAQTLCDRLHSILSNAPYKPIVWTQPAGVYYNDSSTAQAFMPWCIRPPGVGGITNMRTSL